MRIFSLTSFGFLPRNSFACSLKKDIFLFLEFYFYISDYSVFLYFCYSNCRNIFYFLVRLHFSVSFTCFSRYFFVVILGFFNIPVFFCLFSTLNAFSVLAIFLVFLTLQIIIIFQVQVLHNLNHENWKTHNRLISYDFFVYSVVHRIQVFFCKKNSIL